MLLHFFAGLDWREHYFNFSEICVIYVAYKMMYCMFTFLRFFNFYVSKKKKKFRLQMFYINAWNIIEMLRDFFLIKYINSCPLLQTLFTFLKIIQCCWSGSLFYFSFFCEHAWIFNRLCRWIFYPPQLNTSLYMYA